MARAVARAAVSLGAIAVWPGEASSTSLVLRQRRAAPEPKSRVSADRAGSDAAASDQTAAAKAVQGGQTRVKTNICEMSAT